MPACPICSTEATQKRQRSPYWVCYGCGVWFQDPAPPKLWHGPHEGDPTQMGADERAINAILADWLMGEVMQGKPGPTLDIGCALPVLAEALARHGCAAFAIDGESAPGSHRYVERGSLSHLHFDFETDDIVEWCRVQPDYPAPRDGRFALLTFIHSFEHLYDPVAAFRKARTLIADDGALFVRMPDNQVPGYERDLTEGHYTIHGFFHCLSSIAELCAQTETFVIEKTYELRPGQRDLLLRPI